LVLAGVLTAAGALLRRGSGVDLSNAAADFLWGGGQLATSWPASPE
jgi:hypothetical protein